MEYQIIHVGSGRVFRSEGVNKGNFRVFCRPYLTDPMHLGEKLEVRRRKNPIQDWEVIFLASSIEQGTGRIIMTDITRERNTPVNPNRRKKNRENTMTPPAGNPCQLSPDRLCAMPVFSGPENLRKMYELVKDIFDKVQKEQKLWRYVIGYPILWFGNYGAYEKSKIKLITVGLNPSCGEFPNSFKRFPAWDPPNEMTSDKYFRGLNEYFHQDSYSWFTNFAKRINLGNVWKASYSADGLPYSVLHIDFHTPCATTPTWNGQKAKQGGKKEVLPSEIKEELINIQGQYFSKLLDFLTPDIVFIGSNSFAGFSQTLNCPPELIADMNHAQKGYGRLQEMISNLKTKEGKENNCRGDLKFHAVGKIIFISGKNMGFPFACYPTDGMAAIMSEFLRVHFPDYVVSSRCD